VRPVDGCNGTSVMIEIYNVKHELVKCPEMKDETEITQLQSIFGYFNRV